MNKELVKKWITALRSGNYKQCTSKLTSFDKTLFCCLGVAIDIDDRADEFWKSYFDNKLPWVFEEVPPLEVAKNLGLIYTGNFEGGINFEQFIKLERNSEYSQDLIVRYLIELNDRWTSFSVIADWIEACILPRTDIAVIEQAKS